MEFRGLDVYSMRHSIDEVLGYLDKTDPQLAKRSSTSLQLPDAVA